MAEQCGYVRHTYKGGTQGTHKGDTHSPLMLSEPVISKVTCCGAAEQLSPSPLLVLTWSSGEFAEDVITKVTCSCAVEHHSYLQITGHGATLLSNHKRGRGEGGHRKVISQYKTPRTLTVHLINLS